MFPYRLLIEAVCNVLTAPDMPAFEVKIFSSNLHFRRYNDVRRMAAHSELDAK